MAITFRVYPSGSPGRRLPQDEFYYKVVVYPSHAKMYRGYRCRNLVSENSEKPDFAAIVMPRQIERYNKGKHTVSPFLGYILLSMEHLNMEILAHEATHAAVYYVKRIHKTQFEEALAFAVGRIARELITRYRNWA